MIYPHEGRDIDIVAPAQPTNAVIPLTLFYSHLANYMVRRNTQAAGALVSLLEASGLELDHDRVTKAIAAYVSNQANAPRKVQGECVKG